MSQWVKRSKSDKSPVSHFPNSPDLCRLILKSLDINTMLIARCTCQRLALRVDAELGLVQDLALVQVDPPERKSSWVISRNQLWLKDHGTAKVLRLKLGDPLKQDTLKTLTDLMPRVHHLHLAETHVGWVDVFIKHYASQLKTLVCNNLTRLYDTVKTCAVLERLVCCSPTNPIEHEREFPFPRLRELQVQTDVPNGWCTMLCRHCPMLESLRLEIQGESYISVHAKRSLLLSQCTLIRPTGTHLSSLCLDATQTTDRLEVTCRRFPHLDTLFLEEEPSEQELADIRAHGCPIRRLVVRRFDHPEQTIAFTHNLVTDMQTRYHASKPVYTLYVDDRAVPQLHQAHPELAKYIRSSDEAISWRFWTIV